MKSFKKYLQEQGPPPPVKIPLNEPLSPSIDPRDLEVINAFFRGEPDVVGMNIQTKMDDDADFNADELRIDLLYGRGKLGLAQLANDIIYLGQLGTMVDDTPEAKVAQATVRNMAKSKDVRVM
jgi:hypothetical protein